MTFLRLVALVLAAAAPCSAVNWPQWRGPKNDGVSAETNLPAAFSPTKNVLWTAKMSGMGGATPCVWGDRIFLTSEEERDLVAQCFSTSGKELWKKALGKSTGKARKDEGNGASASPSTDGKHVWFFVGSGDLACLDFEGKEVWKFNLQERYGQFKIQFGMHSTPVLHEGRLYLQLMHDGGQYVICLDGADGKQVWKVDRPSDGRDECLHSYASCFLWTNGKDAYLVAHGNDYTTAHDLKDGKEIWRLGGLNPKGNYNRTLRFVASPLCTPELIVVPTAKNGSVVALKPTATGKVEPGSPHEVWRKPNGTPDVPSPLLHDGIVYLVRENGFFQALDATTGVEHYPPQRLYNDRHRASPVYADGKIYVVSRQGVVNVLKAGPRFEVLATNRMDDEMTASPVVVDGRIYLRGFNNLYAIGTK